MDDKIHQLRVEWTHARRSGDYSMMKIIEARAKMLQKKDLNPDMLWDNIKEVFGTDN